MKNENKITINLSFSKKEDLIEKMKRLISILEKDEVLDMKGKKEKEVTILLDTSLN
jgi:hypothetical protein